MAKNKKGAKGAKHKADVDGTGTAHGSARDETATRSIGREDYEAQLHMLQIELVKLQRHFIKCNDRILILWREGTAQARTAASSGWSNT